MDTEHILNEKIILLLEKLTNDHPELVSFLDETQLSIPDSTEPKINISILQEYLNTIQNFEAPNYRGSKK
jgi:hypothetical protein